jgi:type IV pilus assembly protein PilN
MIRINLLQGERAAKRRASFQFGSLTQKTPLLSSVILLAAILYVGYAYWNLSQREVQMDEQLAQARQEEARLQSVLKQVEEFEARKKQLRDRVTLIEDLRKGQSAPVHLLDELSRSLPDRLWLTDMRQTGEFVELGGRTSTLTALADFVGNLESTGYFARPVEILSSEEERGPANASTVLIRFAMKAQYLPPGAAPLPAPGAKPVSAPAAPAR